MLATASQDSTAKVIDFKTEKVLFIGSIPFDSNLLYIIGYHSPLIFIHLSLYIIIRTCTVSLLHLVAATEDVAIKIEGKYKMMSITIFSRATTTECSLVIPI